jgi:cytochrome c553
MRILSTTALCLAIVVPARAWSQGAPVQRPERLGLCAACHGETGRATMPGAPNLAGQSLDYLRSALKQYRDGRRDAPIMRAAIGPVSAADLDALARWYSAQSSQPQATP